MARKLEPLKFDALADSFGQGFEEDLSMSFHLKWKGKDVLVFMHALDVYVLVPHDFDFRNEIVKSEKEILSLIRDDFGKEIRSLTLVQTYLH